MRVELCIVIRTPHEGTLQSLVAVDRAVMVVETRTDGRGRRMNLQERSPRRLNRRQRPQLQLQQQAHRESAAAAAVLVAVTMRLMLTMSTRAISVLLT